MAHPLAALGSLVFSMPYHSTQHVRLRNIARQVPSRQQHSRRQGCSAVAAAASAAGSSSAPPGGMWEEALTDLLSAEGGWDPDSPHLQECVRRGSALVSRLAGREGVGLHLAMQLAMAQCQLEAADTRTSGSTDSGGNSGGLISAKFDVFRRLTSAEPGWAAALGRALADYPAAAALPLADTHAALRFAAAQVGAEHAAVGRRCGLPAAAAPCTRPLCPWACVVRPTLFPRALAWATPSAPSSPHTAPDEQTSEFSNPCACAAAARVAPAARAAVCALLAAATLPAAPQHRRRAAVAAPSCL